MKRIVCVILSVALVLVAFLGCTNVEKTALSLQSGVVIISRGGLTSSGIVAANDDRCLIITNHHGLIGTGEITVTFSDGVSSTATLLGRSSYLDIAVLSTDVKEGAHVFDLTGSIKKGQDTLSLGYVDGRYEYHQGKVSTVDEHLYIADDEKYLFVARVDSYAPVGTSGGACVDLSGRLVALNAFNAYLGGELGKRSYKLPVELVRAVFYRVLWQNQAGGDIGTGFVINSDGGVEVSCLDGGLVLNRDLTVEQTALDFLSAGDKITSINDKPASLTTLLAELVLSRENIKLTVN